MNSGKLNCIKIASEQKIKIPKSFSCVLSFIGELEELLEQEENGEGRLVAELIVVKNLKSFVLLKGELKYRVRDYNTLDYVVPRMLIQHV